MADIKVEIEDAQPINVSLGEAVNVYEGWTGDYNDLNNLPDLTLKADKSDTYTKIEVDTSLAGKAELIHVHTISSVTGLQVALDGKQPVGDYATTSELVDGLDTKQPTGDYATNTALTSGLATKADTSSLAPVATSGAYTDLTNKPTIPVITGKADITYVDTQDTSVASTAQTNLTAHTGNTSNPHSVTKAQVGLGNVANLAPADMPVSSATQTALDAKANKTDTYTKTEVDTKDATKADKLMATNLITNGDFSDGLPGWRGSGTGSTLSNTEGKLTVLAGGRYKGTYYSITTVTGNIYYLAMTIDGPTKIYYGLRYTPANIYKTFSGSERVSRNFNATTTSNSIDVLDSQVTDNTSFTIDDVVFIDLTATFGAGNEPSKETMDRLLAEFPNSWFDGTAELMSLKTVRELLDEKANKAQEGWNSPTLLNGWTQIAGQEAAYMKDTLGFMHFKGTVTTGTLSSVIFNLPAGYRPAQPRSFATVVSSSFGRINVAPGGSVIFAAGLASLVYLDGITYKAEV